MGKPRKQYADDLKREAVRMMRNRGTRTVAEVADDLGVPSNLLHRWAQKFEQDAVAKRNTDGETLEQEVKRLRKENEHLQMEKAILKKLIQQNLWASQSGSGSPPSAWYRAISACS